MADNFDLKKFLKESKALENLNPILRKENLNEGDLRSKIKEMIIAELSDNDLEDATIRAEKGDSTDLTLHMAGIKENDPNDDDPEGMAYKDYHNEEEEYYPSMQGLEDTPMDDYYRDDFDPRLMEAKKDEEEVEVEDTETEEVPAEEAPEGEEAPAEEAPAAGGGGLEDVAANMEGTEGELMDHLMSAFKIAKGMNNEKLETQVGNTLKFFVSEYIGGGEE